jgi:C1A family cysteine protease
MRTMNVTSEGLGLGWLPDYPDFRDYSPTKGATPTDAAPTDAAPKGAAPKGAEPKGAAPTGETRDVPELLATLNVTDTAASVPTAVDLRAGFSPIEDQGPLGSCTANAGVGLLEYFERTASGRSIDASRLFLYKATRNLMGQTGDTGAFLRVTMQAMVLFGMPPEDYWPYVPATFDGEPTAFCYAFANNYRSIQYYRLDPPDVTDPEDLLARIKTNLAAKLPSMFGFTVYSSYTQAAKNGGAFPVPVAAERRVGGHAIVACGYDDKKETRNTAPGAKPSRGAFRIRNSWGTSWGDAGYGWLPYDFVRMGLARDWWSLLKSEWVDTGVFGAAD